MSNLNELVNGIILDFKNPKYGEERDDEHRAFSRRELDNIRSVMKCHTKCYREILNLMADPMFYDLDKMEEYEDDMIFFLKLKE